jgi:Acetokinase family
VDRIGDAKNCTLIAKDSGSSGSPGRKWSERTAAPDHVTAMQAILQFLRDAVSPRIDTEVAAVGHRIVHGLDIHSAVLLDSAVRSCPSTKHPAPAPALRAAAAISLRAHRARPRTRRLRPKSVTRPPLHLCTTLLGWLASRPHVLCFALPPMWRCLTPPSTRPCARPRSCMASRTSCTRSTRCVAMDFMAPVTSTWCRLLPACLAWRAASWT